MTLTAEKCASTNQLTFSNYQFLRLLCLLFWGGCWGLTFLPILVWVKLLYIIGQHVIHTYFVTHFNPHPNHSLYFTSALLLQEYCKYACFKFESEFNLYVVFVFSEEHAFLEGVLSSWSGGPEPCTGAGLPLEGHSWHTSVLPPKPYEAPEHLSAACVWGCTLEPDSESVSLFQGLAQGICFLTSNWADNFPLKPEELWRFGR